MSPPRLEKRQQQQPLETQADYDALVQDVFVKRYEEGVEWRVNHLEQEIAVSGQTDNEFAAAFYQAFRLQPDDDEMNRLSALGYHCRKLVFDIVNTWKDHDFSDQFATAVRTVLGVPRFLRVVRICLIFDRMNALLKLEGGKPWFSKLHRRWSDLSQIKSDRQRAQLERHLKEFRVDSVDVDCEAELENHRKAVDVIVKAYPSSRPPMNKRYLWLYYCPGDVFGLRAAVSDVAELLTPVAKFQDLEL